MWLRSLGLRGVRNLEAMSLEFSPGVNWVVGANGAGKTSVLESISLLATSRSFRGAEVGPVVQFGHADLLVTGQVEESAIGSTHLGVARNRAGETVVKRDGELLRRSSELARIVPTYVFDAGAIQRLYQGSAGRRSLLDWGVFHVEQRFGDLARLWKQTLANRNALLRRQQRDQLDFWDHQFSLVSEDIERLRHGYFSRWITQIDALAAQFGLRGVRVTYRRGWTQENPLLETLQRTREQDIHAGRTTHGPHRTDLRMASEVGLARDTLSRGQQKALAAALILGQIFVREGSLGTKPIALIDDLVAELDSERAAAVIALLRHQGIQSFCAVIDLPSALVDRREDVVVRVSSGKLVSA